VRKSWVNYNPAMPYASPLEPSRFYHLYNRGNNRENLFREERNYTYFLELYARHVMPVADTYAYCLMPNHFHLLVRMKNFQRPDRSERSGRYDNATRAFQSLFKAYAQAINKGYNRTGKLFSEHFKRKLVDSDLYFTNLIFYIHFNPQKHGFVKDFRDWPWSSYATMMKSGPTKVMRGDVLDWFDGRERFEAFHRGVVDEKLIAPLIAEDFD
jgi:REP element-mobilizing transposase RayT